MTPTKPITAAGFQITLENGQSLWADENGKTLPGTARRLPNEYPKNPYGKAFLGDMRSVGGARVDGGMGHFTGWWIKTSPEEIIQEWDDSCALHKHALGPKHWSLCVGNAQFPCPEQTAEALVNALDLRYILESPYAVFWATVAAHCRRALEDGNMIPAHMGAAREIVSGKRIIAPLALFGRPAGNAVLAIFEAGFGIMPEPVWTQEHRDFQEMSNAIAKLVEKDEARRRAQMANETPQKQQTLF